MKREESLALLDTYFKIQSDKSVIFNGEKLIIQIPESFFNNKNNISQIVRQRVSTLGIFEGYIFDDVYEDEIDKASHKFTMKLPCILFLSPSHIEPSYTYEEDIETDTLVKQKAYNLIFLKGDIFLASTIVLQNIHTTDAFICMMLNGHIPSSVTYEELPLIYYNCANLNDSGDLGSDFNALALSTMQLTRDPMDYSVPFRMVFDKYYEKGIYNGKMIRYMDIPKYISNFTSLTTADPKHGITVAMERIYGENQKDQKSPVEELIK